MGVETARAFWVVAPGRGEIRAEAIRTPRSDEVLVRTLFSGISRGTEALVFQGRVPPTDADRLLYQRMDHPTPPQRLAVGQQPRNTGPTAGFKLD